MATPAKEAVKHVKPILSLTPIEARRRVISLYKTWYRQIPFICKFIHYISSSW